MNRFNLFIVIFATSSLFAASQTSPPPEPALTEKAAGCDPKVCPKQDPDGKPPVSCRHEYGISTGFRCILLCTYPDSQWGTVVASNDCD